MQRPLTERGRDREAKTERKSARGRFRDDDRSNDRESTKTISIVHHSSWGAKPKAKARHTIKNRLQHWNLPDKLHHNKSTACNTGLT